LNLNRWIFFAKVFALKKKSKKLEKIPERPLRFVYDDYLSSSETLLENAKVPTLQVRRIRTNSFTVSSHDSILF
jgi:hypothetical protein